MKMKVSKIEAHAHILRALLGMYRTRKSKRIEKLMEVQINKIEELQNKQSEKLKTK